ncbi:MAG: lipid A biosynthesis acyltransferase [Gammaproteobacteria bacterium]|nr:lipid A biosynthesis acyltransferase [Gammaproteobacteria bacterium]
MRDKLILYLIRLFSRMPLRLLHRMGVVIGWLFYLVPNRERQNAWVNIGLCMSGLSEKQRRIMLRESLIESAKGLLEMPAVWLGEPEHWLSRLEVAEGVDLPRELLELNRGVIIAAPHLGCWEAGGHYLATLAPLTVLYRPPRQKVLEQIIKEGRSKGGARLVPTTSAGVKALIAALRRKEMIAILPDQQPNKAGRSAGTFAPFFGHQALTMNLINRLVRKTGAVVLYGFAERLPRAAGYRGYFLRAPEGLDDEDQVTAAAALNQGVENCVIRCPTQYQWSYKRFESRPEGEVSPYRKKKKRD